MPVPVVTILERVGCYMIQESLKLSQCSRQYYYAGTQFALLFCLCCQVSEGLLWLGSHGDLLSAEEKHMPSTVTTFTVPMTGVIIIIKF